ncbi:hypothetical protein KI688_012965 [Linnemannia hyalina]|uniref:Uncharacterized protein n=1 Tax=Linnemannia hyalina TaxID=64524 RepID=A0A9P7XUV7_9FUNG|nr:hypothetical protein KI688_012965 [Linnemannia hyalina]
MIGIKSALGLMCLLLGATTPSTTLAAPVIGSDTTTSISLDSNTQLAKRSFNPRQKWQSDELNCVQILNPSPGATYHPGYFVRLNYGAGQCDATAAGPWTIHLYNNLDIQGGKVSYDYHEVIASGVNEYKTQYMWTIPNNQNSKTKNVKKTNEYYVRIETHSQEGVKLVGNAGPFAISPQHDSGNGGLRTLAEDVAHPLEELRRRGDAPAAFATEPEGNFLAEFALRPQRPFPVNEVIFTPPTPSVIVAPAAATVTKESVAPGPAIPAPVAPAAVSAPVASVVAPKEPVTVAAGTKTTDANVPTDIDVTTDSNGSKVQLNDPKAAVAVDTQDKNLVDINAPDVTLSESGIAAIVAPTIKDPVAAAVTTDGSSVIAEIPAITEIPEPLNTAPTDEIHPPVTEIAHTSFVPGKLLVAGAVAGGAIGAGILGASFFGQVGGIIGAVVGGVIGSVAVLLNFIGVPV